MNHPLPDGDVDALVATILAHGLVGFPQYARVAMAERDIDESDIRNALRAGSCTGHRWAKGTCRYEICTDRFVVIVAFRGEEHLVIVTAWKQEAPG